MQAHPRPQAYTLW